MKNIKKIFAIVMVFAMAMAAVACSAPEPANTEAPANATSASDDQAARLADGVNRVGFAFSNTMTSAIQATATAFQAKCEELGFDDVIVLGAEDKVETQISQIRDLITANCDVICIYSADPDAIVSAVEACNDAGIPVITVDRVVNGGDIFYYIGSDSFNDGRDVANYFAASSGAAAEAGETVKLLHIIGDLSSSAQADRAVGFRAGVEGWGHMEIVAEPATDANPDKIYDAVIDAFSTNPDIGGIFVPYDDCLQSVVAALKDLGKLYPIGTEGHVMLGSVDGCTEQLGWLVNEGYNDITMSLQFALQGEKAAEVAWDYIVNGNDSYAGNSYKTSSFLCTKYNVEYLSAQDGWLWGAK